MEQNLVFLLPKVIFKHIIVQNNIKEKRKWRLTSKPIKNIVDEDLCCVIEVNDEVQLQCVEHE